MSCRKPSSEMLQRQRGKRPGGRVGVVFVKAVACLSFPVITRGSAVAERGEEEINMGYLKGTP